ncbi:PREDICTED: uncharacterized protein LOC105559890 [Vollenhovia emeryi]|uniref:uncharacterized protein LOC105559890 n=1 Tax=Vollenhovia emeryi TaxID=411798 RepID=UPI0005F54DCC|nr:PREDICTED: uncharacterized protein LOC105559890 [Vollenhovia emeryi]
MEHPGEHHYKLNRVILSFSGLWPYQSKWSAHLIRAVISILLVSSVIFQVASFFTTDFTAEFIVEVVPALVPTLGTLSQLYVRTRQGDQLRDIFEHMRNDWRLQKTQYEIKIMRQHAESTRLYTFYYARKKNISKVRFIQRKR